MTRHAEDNELISRAAWLHFTGGLTQGEVASRLGISAARAHRAIAKAQAIGMVHIVVKATSSECLELENKLARAFGLTMCRVAMDLPEPGDIPLKSLGATGGEWLSQVIESKAHDVIGVSHGRTIAAMVEQIGAVQTSTSVFVSLLGGLTRSLSANPYDVIHRLAQKTGGDGYLMPVPLFANSAEDRNVLMAQSMLSETFARMRSATLAIVGIGDLHTSVGAAQIDAEAVSKTGAAAEILGQFLDKDGRRISTALDGRTMAMSLDDLAGREVVAIAGGTSKVSPIRAALKSGLLTGLIIDEKTARALVDGLEGEEAVAAE